MRDDLSRKCSIDHVQLVQHDLYSLEELLTKYYLLLRFKGERWKVLTEASCSLTKPSLFFSEAAPHRSALQRQKQSEQLLQTHRRFASQRGATTGKHCWKKRTGCERTPCWTFLIKMYNVSCTISIGDARVWWFNTGDDSRIWTDEYESGWIQIISTH